MAEEISVRLLFPQVDIPEDVHSFRIDKDVSAILEYSVSRYPEKVLPSSMIFISNEQHFYDHVPSDTHISDLNLTTQTQVVIVPESYEINVTNTNNKTSSIKVRSMLCVGDIVGYICAHSQCQDPKYYQFTSKNVVFDQTLPLAAQSPFAKDFTINLLEPNALIQLLQKDFIEGSISCAEKEAAYIMASLFFNVHGLYKSSENRQMIEQMLSELVPHGSEEKKLISDAFTYYKKLKESPDRVKDLCEYIMNLHHFNAIVLDGERYYGLVGKKLSKDKVTISLGYSILKFYKQKSLSVYDTYDINDMRDIQMDDMTTFRFNYKDPSKGKTLVKVVAPDITEIYKTIVNRLKAPTMRRHSGSSAGSDAFDQIQIPSFAQLFNYYSEVPHAELVRITGMVVINLLQKVKENVLILTDDVRKKKSIPNDFFNNVKLVASITRLVDLNIALNLYNEYSKLQSINKSLERMIEEKRNFAFNVNKNLSSKEIEKVQQQMVALESGIRESSDELLKVVRDFPSRLDSIKEMLDLKVNEPSTFNFRPIAINCIKVVMLLLFDFYWINEKSDCKEQITKIKEIVLVLIKSFNIVKSYSIDASKNIVEMMDTIHELVIAANNVSLTIDKKDQERAFLQEMTKYTVEEVTSTREELKNYFEENKPMKLVETLTKDIKEIKPDEVRVQLKRSKEIMSQLSTKIDSLNDAEDKLKKLHVYVSTILGMAPTNTHEPVIIAFNEMKRDVEQSFVSNGIVDPTASCERCEAALESAFQAMNPANELRVQLGQFPADDPRVKALIPIVDYLDENGPLYTGSSTQVDIQRFIMQMSLAKTATLVEIAFTVESHVPENLRHLTETCDPCKDLYKEVEGDLDINQLADQAKASSKDAVTAATTLRKSVRDFERECAKKYRTLNTYLWRTLKIFRQFSIDEIADTVGAKTFDRCRAAIKVLIEEMAFDMKRDRTFLPFIDELIELFNQICQNPHDAHGIGNLITFLMDHQTHRSFYEAARALNDYNHLILCNDSDKAAKQLVSESITEYEFKTTALMISQIKSRLINLQEKIVKAMSIKTTVDVRRSHVDLREDYALFVKKFNENIFIVFAQMVASKSRNQAAIQLLSTGVEAMEKLFPSIMNIEYPAPYLSHSVCGIVLYSMDAILEESKKYVTKVFACTRDASLAVREYLFNVRRKIATVEREQAMIKTGIGISDMNAITDRENRAITAASNFQRAIRKQKWKYQ